MIKHKWQVWLGDDIDNVVFEGSKTACQKYYKQHGGSKANLHLGYCI